MIEHYMVSCVRTAQRCCNAGRVESVLGKRAGTGFGAALLEDLRSTPTFRLDLTTSPAKQENVRLHSLAGRNRVVLDHVLN